MDTTKLKELAERATPGPWSCNRHWAIVGGPVLEFTNGAAQQQIAMACGQSWMHDEELRNNAEWIAAANPKAILGLIADLEEARNGMEYQPIMRLKNELDRLKAENEALRKDAERYRWLRDLPRGTSHGALTIMLAKKRPAPNQWCTDTIRGESLDAAIDAALEGGGR